jgi:hypothetical protein
MARRIIGDVGTEMGYLCRVESGADMASRMTIPTTRKRGRHPFSLFDIMKKENIQWQWLRGEG